MSEPKSATGNKGTTSGVTSLREIMGKDHVTFRWVAGILGGGVITLLVIAGSEVRSNSLALSSMGTMVESLNSTSKQLMMSVNALNVSLAGIQESTGDPFYRGSAKAMSAGELEMRVKQIEEQNALRDERFERILSILEER